MEELREIEDRHYKLLVHKDEEAQLSRREEQEKVILRAKQKEKEDVNQVKKKERLAFGPGARDIRSVSPTKNRPAKKKKDIVSSGDVGDIPAAGGGGGGGGGSSGGGGALNVLSPGRSKIGGKLNQKKELVHGPDGDKAVGPLGNWVDGGINAASFTPQYPANTALAQQLFQQKQQFMAQQHLVGDSARGRARVTEGHVDIGPAGMSPMIRPGVLPAPAPTSVPAAPEEYTPTSFMPSGYLTEFQKKQAHSQQRPRSISAGRLGRGGVGGVNGARRIRGSGVNGDGDEDSELSSLPSKVHSEDPRQRKNLYGATGNMSQRPSGAAAVISTPGAANRNDRLSEYIDETSSLPALVSRTNATNAAMGAQKSFGADARPNPLPGLPGHRGSNGGMQYDVKDFAAVDIYDDSDAHSVQSDAPYAPPSYAGGQLPSNAGKSSRNSTLSAPPRMRLPDPVKVSHDYGQPQSALLFNPHPKTQIKKK